MDTISGKAPLNRRSLFKIAAAILLFLLSPFSPSLAWGKGKRKELTLFLELSQHLTGFDRLDRALAKSFLKGIKKKFREKEVLTFLGDYEKEVVKGLSPFEAFYTKTIGSSRLRTLMAFDIISLWYTGYADHWQEEKSVIAQAYKKGLVWKTIGVTPMGVPDKNNWGNSLEVSSSKNS